MASITLKTAADCAYAAYQATSLNPHSLLEKVEFFENTKSHTEGFVASDGKLVIVSFAGTSDIQDWMTNAFCKLTTVHLSGGYAVRLHTGFYNAYLSVATKVQNLIDQHMNDKTKKLVFTGHSLGGALAINASLECRAQDVDYKVITFGCPKPGGWCLHSLLNPFTVRIVARGDKVPRLPFMWTPWRPKFFYSHVGRSIKRGFYVPGVANAHSMKRYRELAYKLQEEMEVLL